MPTSLALIISIKNSSSDIWTEIFAYLGDNLVSFLSVGAETNVHNSQEVIIDIKI